MSIEDDVKAANTAFYKAFRERDMTAMDKLWTKTYPTCCVHPGQAPLFDRQDIIDSWYEITGDPGSPNISSKNERVQEYDPEFALVVCEEDIADNDQSLVVLTATNAFICQGGVWLICHHHAGRRR